MARIIYLSPSSHGTGANKGITKGCYEDGHTRPIAEVTAKHLEYNGFEAVIAKKGSTLAQRCAESDRIGADLHLPIHTNACADEDVRYLMMMFYDDTAEYQKLFDAMDDFIEAVYPGHKDAVFAVRKDLIEINTPKAKTMYLELGFHTNKTDSKFMHDEETVGKALAKGICKIYGVKFKDGDSKDKDDEKKPAPKPAEGRVVEEDGLWGVDTTKATQKLLGSYRDGVVSNQLYSCKEYLPNMLDSSWEFSYIARGGSPMIEKLQALVGAEVDGYAGEDTMKDLQSFLKKKGLYSGKIDGIGGSGTVTGWQKYLNKKLA